jgi:primosomal replication protein N
VTQEHIPDHRPPLGRRERLKFVEFKFDKSPAGRTHVEVGLEYQGMRYTGRAEGQSTPLVDLRLAADAVAQAVQSFLGVGAKLEVVGVKLTRSFDADVAICAVRWHPSSSGLLVGCCLADRNQPRAAALAVLNATNRMVEMFIADSRAQPSPPS